MEMDEAAYFWSKNSGPTPEKDHTRNSIASLCLSHLKTEASVLKTVHVPPETSKAARYRTPEDKDLSPYLIYSLNKKRRWEVEDQLGVDLLSSAQKMNDGWKVLFLERVNLRSWLWPVWSYGSGPERYLNDFLVRGVHQFDLDGGYKECKLNSVFGQRFSHFLEENRKPEKERIIEKVSEPLVAYNFLRAPSNYMTLLQKQYQSSNYGWEWPHHRYWRRIDLLKNHVLELRYGELEDPSEEIDYDTDVNFELEEQSRASPNKFYNLEDHIVDTDFVIVKKKKTSKRRRKTSKITPSNF
uniref:Uncharacterized protein n=1 Tax=Caenorhabditis japonica TaxID=281687 RepID=A0A8R1DFL5_CAEJA